MSPLDRALISSEPIDYGGVLQRVINPAGVPYSVIIVNGEEVATCPTEEEERMLAYWSKSKSEEYRRGWQDAISRQAVIRAILAFKDKLDIAQAVRDLPSVQPIRPRGHWIDRSDGGRILYPWWESNECSECGEFGSGAWKYCQNCGADMRESEEAQDAN